MCVCVCVRRKGTSRPDEGSAPVSERPQGQAAEKASGGRPLRGLGRAAYVEVGSEVIPKPKKKSPV